jgi:hypothetical protein
MSKGDPVTYEELTPEHKQIFDEIKALFEADLIGSFERTHNHGIRWNGLSPEGALDGVDLSLPSEECTRALRQEVNYMVAHSLHWHSESLVNTFERVALRVVQEIMKNQYSPLGPALGSHKGELPFQTRPPLPYTLAAPESTSHLRKSHTGMHVHTYQIAATRYVRFSRPLGEFLGWMLISKHGWLSSPLGNQISAILRISLAYYQKGERSATISRILVIRT